MKTTVVYHSADYDGIFCREIARKFLPEAELIGWDFGDAPLKLSGLGEKLYVLDLPMDRPFGIHETRSGWVDWPVGDTQVVWIDHHKSSIETHNPLIPGYRIDGVAACRLAWQYFLKRENIEKRGYSVQVLPCDLPDAKEFIDRKVAEPLAVRLAGEYDIWDKRDPNAELFQHGLRSRPLDPTWWKDLLGTNSAIYVDTLLEAGKGIQYAKTHENESIIKHAGFTAQFEGLNFLVCNHARFNSHLFTAGLTPEHDACLGFCYDGKQWKVSLYHAPGKEHHDLSVIAKKYGGGGHRGACGFVIEKLPFLA